MDSLSMSRRKCSNSPSSWVSLLKSEEFSTLFPEDGSRINFGTSWLRSTMEPGPLRMNDLFVIQATHGIACYCQQQGKISKVVIGYDEDQNMGKWTMFAGKKIGTILDHWLWETVGSQSDWLKVSYCVVFKLVCGHCV